MTKSFYRELDNVLDKHPSLRLILAHFYFLSDDMPRAARFLDAHPSVSFDITSGFEMYENFSKKPDAWRTFFIQYADRLLYGTDSTDNARGEELKNQQIINGAQLHCIMKAGPYQAWDKTIIGLCLPEAVQRRILYENFEALSGLTPAPINIKSIMAEGEILLAAAYRNMMFNSADELHELLHAF